MAEKIYYWLKLKNDFFRQKEIKRLRGIAGGEVYVIIYLKMLLLSLDNDGFLIYEHFYDSFADELADQIDEKTDNVKIVLTFLTQTGLLIEVDENTYQLTKCKDMTGKETSAAIRKRKSRQNKKLLQEKSDENNLIEQKEEEKQGNKRQNVTMSHRCHNVSRDGHTEIEIEKEIDIELKKANAFSNSFGQKNLTEKEKIEKPTVEAVENCETEFENLWKQIPKKQGKQEAKKAFIKAVKEGAVIADIEKGIKAYNQYLKNVGTDYQFIMKGGKFFMERAWEDDYSVKNHSSAEEKPSYDLELFESFANQITLYDDSKEKKQ